MESALSFAVSSPWIFRPVPRPRAALRLVCFPYAGAGAAVYRTWPSRFPEDVEVLAIRPPGREMRLREPAHRDLLALVEAAREALLPLLDRPFAFFGHSMGAIVAFEMARSLRRTPGAPMPEHLVLSGRRPPRLPSRHPDIAHLPDDAFVQAIDERYGGIPAEIVSQPEVLRLLLPCLKADVAAVEGHAWLDEEPLEVPITALCGLHDPTTLPEEAEAWSAETTGGFSLGLLPGNHFFVQSAEDAVIRTVRRCVEGGASAPAAKALR